MRRSPENPFGLIIGSMGDWLIKERSRRIRKPPAIVVTPINLPETVQPIEGKVFDPPIVDKEGPTK